MIIKFHHVGIEVKDLEVAKKLYEKAGFRIDKNFDKKDIGKACFVYKNEVGIELWQFEGKKTKITEKIAKHFALESSNVEEDLKIFLDNGYKISLPIAKGAFVKRYAYVEDESGNQIELLELK